MGAGPEIDEYLMRLLRVGAGDDNEARTYTEARPAARPPPPPPPHPPRALTLQSLTCLGTLSKVDITQSAVSMPFVSLLVTAAVLRLSGKSPGSSCPKAVLKPRICWAGLPCPAHIERFTHETLHWKACEGLLGGRCQVRPRACRCRKSAQPWCRSRRTRCAAPATAATTSSGVGPERTAPPQPQSHPRAPTGTAAEAAAAADAEEEVALLAEEAAVEATATEQATAAAAAVAEVAAARVGLQEPVSAASDEPQVWRNLCFTAGENGGVSDAFVAGIRDASQVTGRHLHLAERCGF